MAKVHLISLPIGNLGDLTPRAKELLEVQNSFLAEDTRKFFDFLQRAGISRTNKQVVAFHDHTQGGELDRWMECLNRGEDLYLVSDAGSPIISDPAFPLVRKAIDLGHEIATIPGVSAVTVALELSGLPPHPFYFHGFISREEEKKRNQFSQCGTLKGTHIFFESPQRIDQTLSLLSKTLPDAQVAVARELTKTFESVYRFNASEYAHVKKEMTFKGEFVLLFYNQLDRQSTRSSKLDDLVHEYLNIKAGPKLLAKIFAELTGESSKDIYQKLVGREE